MASSAKIARTAVLIISNGKTYTNEKRIAALTPEECLTLASQLSRELRNLIFQAQHKLLNPHLVRKGRAS